MDLYLVRHAPAFRRDPHRWPHSSRRPLTPEGEEEFRLAARGLATIVHRVDVMLSSPQSTDVAHGGEFAELDCWPAPEPSPALRTGSRRGSPEKATLALEDYANANSVAVVGHKPRLKELAAYLLTGEGDRMKIKIRQGSVVCIRFGSAPRRVPASCTGCYARNPPLSSW